jgi:4-amino-4-deoxy-L-arabinose transferase-like glycosyltransferase
MAKKKKDRAAGAAPARAQAQAPAADRFPAWLVWPVFAAWGVFALKAYYTRWPLDLNSLLVVLAPGQYAGALLSALPGHLLNLLAAAFLLFACFSAGRLALRAAGFAFSGVLEEAAFSCGTGLGLLAAWAFALSCLKLLYLWPVALFLAAAAAAGIFDLYGRAPAPEAERPAAAFGPWEYAAAAVLLAAALLNLAGALAPEIFYDSLVYHLAVPNYYVIKHGFAPMQYNFYSDLPFTHGMIYAAALLVKGEVLAKFVNYAAGLLAAAAVISMGARWFSARAGLWAAVFSYTVAHSMFASWSAGTEALLTLFSVLSLYAMLRREEGRRWLWLSAAFAGLAMGVKYTGLFTAVGVMSVCAWQERRRPAGALKDLALFTLGAAVFVVPWLVKNWLYTGNPVFPFLAGVFGTGPMSDPQKLRDFASHAAQLPPFTLADRLLLPWRVSMGQVANSEYFGPLFILLLPAAFLLGAPGAAAGGLWIFFLAAFCGWSVTSSMVRFLMPAYPAAGLLMSAYLFSPGHRLLKMLLKAAALALCLTGLFWSALVFHQQERWRPLVGAVAKDDYLSHTQPTYPYSAYSAIKFINEKTPPGSKVLFLGDERSFYMKRDFLVSSVYDRCAAVEYASAAKDGEDLYARLKADGFTHILLNTAEAIRLGRDYRMFYWDARAKKVFYDFWDSHAREVFSFDEQRDGRFFNRVAVYELASRPPGLPPSPFNVIRDIVVRNIETPR